MNLIILYLYFRFVKDIFQAFSRRNMIRIKYVNVCDPGWIIVTEYLWLLSIVRRTFIKNLSV
jgi:hypothetical protein